MIEIPIEELLKKTNNNRYLLTILVAKKAVKLMEKQRLEGNLTILTRDSDPISQSIQDILNDKHISRSNDLNPAISSDE